MGQPNGNPETPTVDQVCRENKYVLDDMCALCSLLQHARTLVISDKQSPIALKITLDNLNSSLLSNLVNSLDLLQLLLRDVASSDCTVPWYWSGSDVTLEGIEIGGRI